MVMSIIFLILFVLFVGSLTGRTFNILPLIFFLIVVLFFSFGIELLRFTIHNPWLLLMFLVYFLFRKKRPPQKKSGGFYYYSSNNTHSQKDFEEFFRQAGAGGYSYGQQGYNESIFTQQGSSEKDYENLGIVKGVSKEEVKKAYRDKVKMHHPDRYSNAPEKERGYHEVKIKEINESYEKIIKEFN